MLRCLIPCRSLFRRAARSSWPLTIRRSKKLAAMARYDKTLEVARVVSVIDTTSSSKHDSSFWSGSFSSGCGSSGLTDCGLDAGRLADVAVFVGDGVWIFVGSVFVADEAACEFRGGATSITVLRLLLSRFFFLLAVSLCECFLLRALACCRR